MKKVIAVSLVAASGLFLAGCDDNNTRKEKCIAVGGDYIKLNSSYGCVARINGHLVEVDPYMVKP